MSKNLFNSIKLTKPKTNVFDLSHDVKLSANMGKLVPTMLLECIPGDKINIGCESLLRFAPLVAPMMHRCNVYMHYFFVPNRILWPNWESFITKGIGSAPYLVIKKDGSNYTDLMDYFGIPNPGQSTANNDANVSALPFAAYNKIYNEYYRDQNLIDELTAELHDGSHSDGEIEVVVQNRCWEHDYFTGSLPFAQKGNPVAMPIGVFNDVPVNWRKTGSETGVTWSGTEVPSSTPVTVGAAAGVPDNLPTSDSDLYADTSQLIGQSATINDLRRAFRLQEWLEKAARGGSRYVENILEFFGVKSPDARLQRPEYITGTVSPVVISEVLNTTGTTDLPQGNMSGHGVAVTAGKYGFYNVQEHGYIIGIMSVMPKTAYQQGIDRTWLKFDRMDYYWPPFANIGEQEVQNQELYAFGPTPSETFGYVPRYAEYKYQRNRVAGKFRTDLNTWHMGRIFSSEPNLNNQFVISDPTNRIFAVTDPTAEHLYVNILHKIRAVRSMPKFGTPSF